ncbi:MAG TPA: glycosyltransferase family 4 protein [Blastocatellia bacterium]|nr:glycosyltransferase family 4 protein [Blastocatellia bacterium]
MHAQRASEQPVTGFARSLCSRPMDARTIPDAGPLHVVLNATAEELKSVGGDYSLYRNWLKLTTDTLRFHLLPSHRVRRHHLIMRTIVEKLCYRWQPEKVRRTLFLASRLISLPGPALERADVLLSHILFPWVSGASSPPIIWSTQGLSPAVYYDRYNGRRWTVEDVIHLFRVLGRRADALLISTETCARNLFSVCPELEEKTFLAPAPVFPRSESLPLKPSLEDGVIRLLFVGVNAQLKGLPEVIEAYRHIRRRYPQMRLDIVSRPPAPLRRQIETLSGVRLWPLLAHDEVMALMAQADIFVLPTHADTYALSAVEAMAHGAAIIISDLDPLPEICPPGEVGFTVPAGDAVTLIEKIEALVANPERLRQFQGNARRRYERVHHPTVVAERLQWIIERVSRETKTSLRRR